MGKYESWRDNTKKIAREREFYSGMSARYINGNWSNKLKTIK